MNIRHGLKHHPLYTLWQTIRNRCTNKNNRHYHLYGAKGIAVCERWNDFSLFIKDIGERPQKARLKLIDKSKGYEPGNTMWAKANPRTGSYHKLREVLCDDGNGYFKHDENLVTI